MRLRTFAAAACYCGSSSDAVGLKPLIVGDAMPLEQKGGEAQLSSTTECCHPQAREVGSVRRPTTRLVIDFEFKLPPGGNSGVTCAPKQDTRPLTDEVQISTTTTRSIRTSNLAALCSLYGLEHAKQVATRASSGREPPAEDGRLAGALKPAGMEPHALSAARDGSAVRPAKQVISTSTWIISRSSSANYARIRPWLHWYMGRDHKRRREARFSQIKRMIRRLQRTSSSTIAPTGWRIMRPRAVHPPRVQHWTDRNPLGKAA